MRKQKVIYVLRRDPGFRNREITAKRELSFGIQLASRLLLDQLSFQFNKERLDKQINSAIDNNDREEFDRLSEQYQFYT
ncbi:IDEAL domain-containing protein [Halobacillus shinanisalinarum]|uniref:IDEAL domain-containing protein n=1 Tax=Halobacillus shinanisalinarum TaxID=2932258 RepID=A0ABY4GXD8_9BACI|nr:IDEAL domain-containing protein [Halobacillus shinanisalinarum]UOQ92719.1 IDEAL domain-containing protein [Halobacillus shinanisalinarum]